LNRDLPSLVSGTICFVVLVVSVTPMLLGLFLTVDLPTAGGSRMVGIGAGCAVLFGLPGFYLFPRELRLPAVGWLALACAAYLVLIVGALFVLGPDLPTSPQNRAFREATEVDWVRFAAVQAVLVAVWGLLYRKRRPEPASEQGVE